MDRAKIEEDCREIFNSGHAHGNMLSDERDMLTAEKRAKEAISRILSEFDIQGRASSTLLPAALLSLQEARRENGELRERAEKAENLLHHLAEYWNQDANDNAMLDACWHVINEVEEHFTPAAAKAAKRQDECPF